MVMYTIVDWDSNISWSTANWADVVEFARNNRDVDFNVTAWKAVAWGEVDLMLL